jgi:hypothetical protein
MHCVLIFIANQINQTGSFHPDHKLSNFSMAKVFQKKGLKLDVSEICENYFLTIAGNLL